jgi:hypothetical protein
VNLTYPGVYVQELTSDVHPIVGVGTSIAAFVGYAARGPVDEPTTIFSFADYTRTFGGLSEASTMSYAVAQFLLAGGTQAIILRVVNGATPAQGVTTSSNGLQLEAANPGRWGLKLEARVEVNPDGTTYNLWVKDPGTGAVEVVRRLQGKPVDVAQVKQSSTLVRITQAPTALPDDNGPIAPGSDPFAQGAPYATFTTGGDDGTVDESALAPTGGTGGLWELARADLFNLLCIPPVTAGTALSSPTLSTAAQFAHDHRAVFLVDPQPGWKGPADVLAVTSPGHTALGDYVGGISGDPRSYAALYFPSIQAPDPLNGNLLTDYPPCGAVAGVIAATDAARGVWKAPAGIGAGLNGVQSLTVTLTDHENGQLNPLGVNCLRTLPAAGNVVWGARTLAGNDQLADQWKYLPVRRTALFIEESLYRGLQWVVFEPNDERLWGEIRLNVGAFMQTLFRQGAFQGTSPREAFLVKCDSTTTTQADIDNGVVNILVGFAPLKPAEFVIIQIQQLAGQTDS